MMSEIQKKKTDLHQKVQDITNTIIKNIATILDKSKVSSSKSNVRYQITN